MVAEAIKATREHAEQAKRPEKIEVSSRTFIFQPTARKYEKYEEVRKPKPLPRSAILGAVGALVEWLKRYGSSNDSFVVVSPKTGVMSRLDVAANEHRWGGLGCLGRDRSTPQRRTVRQGNRPGLVAHPALRGSGRRASRICDGWSRGSSSRPSAERRAPQHRCTSR